MIIPTTLTFDYGRTGYTSTPTATPTGLQKDKLHFPSSYHTHQITEGQATLPILEPPWRTCYISPPATTHALP